MTILDFFVKKKIKSSDIYGVEIRRSSKRSRTISLKIKDGKPILSCPNFINDNYLRKLILKKKEWIDSNLKKKKEEIILKKNQNFPILGKFYKIKFLDSESEKIEKIDNEINIFCKKEYQMKEVFLKWLIPKSEKFLKKRISILSKRHKLLFKDIFVKNYRSRWGCCSSDSKIFLNWKLILMHKEIIDYVIIHELTHTLVPNHSKLFWLNVSKYDQNYKENRKWLSRNGAKFINFG